MVIDWLGGWDHHEKGGQPHRGQGDGDDRNRGRLPASYRHGDECRTPEPHGKATKEDHGIHTRRTLSGSIGPA
jgi:hypothetical protein